MRTNDSALVAIMKKKERKTIKGAARLESPLVAQLRLQLRAAKIENYVIEHQFHPSRKWRFDLAFPAEKLAVEVEGGVWSGGRHTTGAGFIADCEKYNAAVLLGWRLLRCHTGTIRSGIIIKEIIIALGKNDGI